MKLPTVACATLMLATAGCVMPVLVPGEPASGSRPDRTDPAPPRSTSWDALRSALLDEVNATRRAHGVRPLADDPRLAAAAIEYAAELARTRRLTHESDTPDRRNLAERLAAAGMTEWQLIGENLAMTAGGAAAMPAQVVRLWLDSPGHRRNLLQAEFTLSGIGVARTGDGYWYVTQVYARPLPRRR
jgi:uncharacterized protein YkwD